LTAEEWGGAMTWLVCEHPLRPHESEDSGMRVGLSVPESTASPGGMNEAG